MADQIVVMRDGLVEQRGEPLELYDQPGEPLRRGLHRLARDEFPARDAAARERRAQVELAGGVRVPAPRGAAGEDGQHGRLRHAPRAPRARDRRRRAFRPRWWWSSRRAPTRRSSRSSATPRSPRSSASATISARARRSASLPDHARTHLFDAESGKSLETGVDPNTTTEETTMSKFTRREFLKTTAGAAAAGTVGAGSALWTPDAFAQAQVDAGEGREAARAALEALRPGRRGHVDGEHQEVHREDRRRGARRQRGLGGRAAQGGGGGQRRQRPGHHHLDRSRTRTSIPTSWST